MMPSRAEILERYKKKETVSDAFGRLITVRRLKMSEQMAVVRLADTQDQALISIFTAAAAVSDIDGAVYPLPKSIEQLNSIVDILDQEGLKAAAEGFTRLMSLEGEMSTDAAKNLQPTPSSDSPVG